MSRIYTKIVGFEMAKKLQEKGFPDNYGKYSYIRNNLFYRSSTMAGDVPAPTYAEVLDWLIDNGINICFRWNHHDITKCSVIINFEGEARDYYKNSLSSLFEALDFGITKALEWV